MKKYLITFINENGYTQRVYIDAKNKERAILSFESSYQFASIKYIDLID